MQGSDRSDNSKNYFFCYSEQTLPVIGAALASIKQYPQNAKISQIVLYLKYLLKK